MAKTTAQKSSRKTIKQFPKEITEPANQKNLIKTRSKSMKIAEHVSGCTSSVGRDPWGSEGCWHGSAAGRASISSGLLTASQSGLLAVGRQSSQLKLQSTARGQEPSTIREFWNNAAHRCSRQKPLVSPWQQQEG